VKRKGILRDYEEIRWKMLFDTLSKNNGLGSKIDRKQGEGIVSPKEWERKRGRNPLL